MEAVIHAGQTGDVLRLTSLREYPSSGISMLRCTGLSGCLGRRLNSPLVQAAAIAW